MCNQKNIFAKIEKTIVFLHKYAYTNCNRVARSLYDIGDQAESCAQLFYVKENFYGIKEASNF